VEDAVEFRLITRSVGNSVVIAADGDVDMKTAPDLQAEVEQTLAGGATAVVIDLTGVEFLDSSGLGAIATARNRAGELNARLSVVCANRNALKLFHITGMDRVLTIHPTVEAATSGVQ
jgi:anti-sigma B factor antagonist